MEPFRLRLKVGAHEFEAEGDQESIERQLAIWRDLIAASPAPSPPLLPSPPPESGGGAPPPAVIVTPGTGAVAATGFPPTVVIGGREDADRVFRHDGRIVSLSAIPQNGQRESDAALLLLWGQKLYNDEDLVTGNQILEGLARSGIRAPRADRVFGEHMDQNVIRVGAHRAVRYRLTNPGMARAKELIAELLTMVS